MPFLPLAGTPGTSKWWSHSAAQALAQGAEGPEADLAREILSKMYSPEALTVLPLSEGSFAIFGWTRQLEALCGPEDLPGELRRVGAEEPSKIEARQRWIDQRAQGSQRPPSGATSGRIQASLEDLDL